MTQNASSFAGELLDSYSAGTLVAALEVLTGLPDVAIMTRLCAASRNNAPEPVSADGSLGVQWRFVFWRA